MRNITSDTDSVGIVFTFTNFPQVIVLSLASVVAFHRAHVCSALFCQNYVHPDLLLLYYICILIVDF